MPILAHLTLLLLLTMQVSCSNSLGPRNGPKMSGQGQDLKEQAGAPSTPLEIAGKEALSIAPTTELRHFIDPYTGAYKTKITIPKNYHGYLYISGLNVSALSDRLISVRFKFGREKESITIPAVIGRATGLTPQTEIQVLILDLQTRPFDGIRLLYDLYDYNQYSAGDEPTQDPYDSQLYCRGLYLADDPTFTADADECDGSSDCRYLITECDSSGDRCLYSFAKVIDNGLFAPNSAIGNGTYATIPTEPQIDQSGSDYSVSSNPSVTEILTRNEANVNKCLPDNGLIYTRLTSGYNQLHTANCSGCSIVTPGNTLLHLHDDDGAKVTYTYAGPYRGLSTSSWVVRDSAIYNSHYGLYGNVMSSAPLAGINSFLFPRAAKLELREDVNYLGSTTAILTDQTVPRSVQYLSSAGETNWMDGCNLRVATTNPLTNEAIHSCNVTATVEIITTNTTTGLEEVITSNGALKLQLTRPSEKSAEGEEVLYDSFHVCSSNNNCKAGECCFNGRCWEESLVGQCPSDAITEGNLAVGSQCTNDFQCSSLCCDPGIGRCQVHQVSSSGEENVYCNKPSNATCVGQEWCAKQTVEDCRIVTTGTDSSGNVTCTLRCYYRQEFGTCQNGVCKPPTAPTRPTFDPSNPDCSQAQSPPTTLD